MKLPGCGRTSGRTAPEWRSALGQSWPFTRNGRIRVCSSVNCPAVDVNKPTLAFRYSGTGLYYVVWTCFISFDTIDTAAGFCQVFYSGPCW